MKKNVVVALALVAAVALAAVGFWTYSRSQKRASGLFPGSEPIPVTQTEDPALIAPEPDSDESEPDAPKNDDGCVAAEPRPVLDPKAYPDFSRQFDRVYQAQVESITLEPMVKLQVIVGGCESYTTTLSFTVMDPEKPAGDVAFWSAFAATRIKNLKYLPDAMDERKEILPFLDKAPSLPLHEGPEGKRSPDAVLVELCRDGSAPTVDGCGFEQLGSVSIRVYTQGRGRVVDVTVYQAL